MRCLVLILTLWGATSALASPLILFSTEPCTPPTTTVQDINDSTEASQADPDTGTEVIGAAGQCAATATIIAGCSTDFGETAAVYLVIDGVEVDSLVCAENENKGDTLSGSASGAYSARVHGDATGGATFSANTFSFPAP